MKNYAQCYDEKTFDEKVEDLAELIQSETLERLERDYPNNDPEFLLKSALTSVVSGRKYTKIDIFNSGKYMVVNDTGEIFGIKAYGQIHRGHQYGTLDTISDYYWGGYVAKRRLS